MQTVTVGHVLPVPVSRSVCLGDAHQTSQPWRPRQQHHRLSRIQWPSTSAVRGLCVARATSDKPSAAEQTAEVQPPAGPLASPSTPHMHETSFHCGDQGLVDVGAVLNYADSLLVQLPQPPRSSTADDDLPFEATMVRRVHAHKHSAPICYLLQCIDSGARHAEAERPVEAGRQWPASHRAPGRSGLWQERAAASVTVRDSRPAVSGRVLCGNHGGGRVSGRFGARMPSMLL